MDNSKTKQPDKQSDNLDKKYPWEFMILMISLSIGSVLLLLKMVGIF